jgi:DNA polymerase III delta subunit
MVRQRSGARLYRDVIRSPRWSPSPVTVLSGAEAFFKRDLFERILEQVAGPNRQPDAVSDLAASGPEDLRAAILDLRTPSFFSTKRAVCVKECDKYLADVDDELIAALREGLPCGVLVLDCERVPGKSAFAKEALERGAVIDCRRLWDSPPPWKANASPGETELHEWVVEHAAGLGLRMPLPVAGELVSLTGNAPGVIDQELRKLRDRIGANATPTAEHILALVPDTRQDSVFRVVDQTLGGELGEAVAGVARLLRQGYAYQGKLTIDPAAIAQLAFGALGNRLRILRRSNELLKEGSSAEALVAAGLVPRPAVHAVAAQLRRWNESTIEEGFRLLLEADRMLKGKFGRVEADVLLELTIMRLARLTGRHRGA